MVGLLRKWTCTNTLPMKYCPQGDSDLSSVCKVLYGSAPVNFISDIRISQLGIYYRIKCDITVCLNQRLVCFSVLCLPSESQFLLDCWGYKLSRNFKV